MTLILKHYGAVRTKQDRDPGKCGGSSKFSNFRDTFTRDISLQLRKSNTVKRLDYIRDEIEKDESRPERTYKMNKGKFKAKAFAYATLRKSMCFLAFYSVSFPAGISDDTAYKILNSCLSVLRKKHGLKSYLWVFERQENGTGHYHILTNDFMYIRDVNEVFASSIDYYVKRGEATWGKSSRIKYNGVDVKSVVKKGTTRNPLTRSEVIEKVTRYLSKYMSKQDAPCTHRVWFCSRAVSALFVSVSFSEDIAGYILDDIYKVGSQWKVVHNFYCDIYFFATIRSDHWLETVGVINEKVWDWFEENGGW